MSIDNMASGTYKCPVDGNVARTKCAQNVILSMLAGRRGIVSFIVGEGDEMPKMHDHRRSLNPNSLLRDSHSPQVDINESEFEETAVSLMPLLEVLYDDIPGMARFVFPYLPLSANLH
jgi:hypothetical protein